MHFINKIEIKIKNKYPKVFENFIWFSNSRLIYKNFVLSHIFMYTNKKVVY